LPWQVLVVLQVIHEKRFSCTGTHGRTGMFQVSHCYARR